MLILIFLQIRTIFKFLLEKQYHEWWHKKCLLQSFLCFFFCLIFYTGVILKGDAILFFLVAIILKNEYLILKLFVRLSGLCWTHNNLWLSLKITDMSKDPSSDVWKQIFFSLQASIRLDFELWEENSSPLSHQSIVIWNYFSLLNSTKMERDSFCSMCNI